MTDLVCYKNTNSTFLFLAFLVIGLSGCGGSSSSDEPEIILPVLPSISLTSSAESTAINTEFTLTWSVSHADFCSASGNWSGDKATSENETITETEVGNKTYTLSCSGDGGDNSANVVVEITDNEGKAGYNSLFMGHSFFRPIADEMPFHAEQLGITGHTQYVEFSGGETGTPTALWEDEEHRNNIQDILDTGEVELFGMTANPTIEGYTLWIDYALSKNPNTKFMIGTPWLDFPADYSDAASYENTIVEGIDSKILIDIETLRGLYPDVEIISLPYAFAAIELRNRFEAGELPGVTDLIGNNPDTSLFKDDKGHGHADGLLLDLAELIWLVGIYDVDLDNYEYESGHSIDLKEVATSILDKYYSYFNRIPMVKAESSYPVRLVQDVIYADGLGHDDSSNIPFAIPLKLDVYYPDNSSTNRPIFMFLHGGGFKGGTKTKPEIVDMANYYASRGWGFISVDYRTTEELSSINDMSQEEVLTFYKGIAPQEWIEYAMQGVETPEQLQQSIAMYAAQRDAKAALRWIVANSAVYNINTDFITVGGASAGAITTIALGISSQEDFRGEISITDDPTLSTTNQNETYNVRSMVSFWGSNLKLDVFESVFGLYRYDSNDPELFMAHGDQYDPVTPYEEALELQGIYDSLDIYHELVTLYGWGHGAWAAEVDGKSLSEITFDFIVDRQNLKVE